MPALTKRRLPWSECLEMVKADPVEVTARLIDDPLLFLSYAWTVDEHDNDHPVKRFPSEVEKPYLWDLAELWVREPLIVLAKSRQMLITWLYTALYLWDATYHEGRLIFFQNKKEDDAAWMLSRARGIHERLEPAIRTPCGYTSTRMSFLHGSEIRAIPQGADQVRSYTASGIFADEAGFQDQFADAFAAAKPVIDGGGRFTIVSTAAPGFFEQLWRGEV